MLLKELLTIAWKYVFVDSGLFMPHGQCFLWETKLLSLHVISDSLTAVSYYAIPVILITFVLKRKDAPFPKLIWMFGAFIVACGTTHLMAVWTMWNPDYWIEGWIKLATGVVSFSTAVMLIPAIPKAMAMPRPQDLKEANRQLKREIEQRKQAEEEVRKLNSELSEKVKDLELANEELQKFSYSVSHDLRAPLRSIDGFSQALLERYDHQLDESGRHYLNRIRNGSQKMGQLIDDILKLSRVSRAELNFDEVDLTQITESIFEELGQHNQEHKADLRCEKAITLYADYGMMENVMRNLIENAWKFASGQPEINIEVGSTEKEGQKVIYVKDNGAGFDMTYYNKLFTPFQRLHSESEYKGSGIGLANIQRIIRRHDGHIWADSEPGKGTTFYFFVKAKS